MALVMLFEVATNLYYNIVAFEYQMSLGIAMLVPLLMQVCSLLYFVSWYGEDTYATRGGLVTASGCAVFGILWAMIACGAITDEE